MGWPANWQELFAASWQISGAVVRLVWRLAAGLSNISLIE